MRKKRQARANAHKDWISEDCAKVNLTYIFLLTTFLCDWSYKILHLICSSSTVEMLMKKKICWKNHLREGPPRPQESTSRIPYKVMVWSVISVMGTGMSEIVEGDLNQIGYCGVIDRRLLSQLREWLPDNDYIFTYVELPVTQPNVLKPVWIIMVLEGSIALKTVRIQIIKCLWKARREEISQLECTNKIEPSERLGKQNPINQEKARRHNPRKPRRAAVVIKAKAGDLGSW